MDLLAVLEELDVAVTVTDLDGRVVYMNGSSAEVNAKAGGRDLVGQQVRDCHNARSREIIERLFSGARNVYTITKAGRRKLIYQSPWREAGEVRGLVELSIVLPDEMPHYDRG